MTFALAEVWPAWLAALTTAGAFLVVAASRGLKRSAAERELVSECTDLATLDRWVVRAATVGRASEIFE